MRNRDLKESTTTTSTTTTNYDLPQWNGEDVTSWMTNLNDAFNKIDSAMWANHTAMAGYDKIASDLQKLADGIKVDNAEIREALRIVQQGMADQLTQLNQAKTDITNINLALSQLQTEDNALSAMIEDLQDDVGMLQEEVHIKNDDMSPLYTITADDGTILEIIEIIFRRTGTSAIIYNLNNIAGKTGWIHFPGYIPEELATRIKSHTGGIAVNFFDGGMEGVYAINVYFATNDTLSFNGHVYVLDNNIIDRHTSVIYGSYYKS